MAFIDYYYKPLTLFGKTSGGLAEQLTRNAPQLFSGGQPCRYIAFCLFDPNLEPLGKDTVLPRDLNPERLPAKFEIAMRSTCFGWCRLNHCLVFVLSFERKNAKSENEIIERYSSAILDFLSMVEADFGISLTSCVSLPFDNPAQCEEAVRDALIMVDFSCFIESRVNVVDPVYYEELKRFLSRKYPEYRLVNYERPIIAAVLNQNYLHAELVLNNLLISHLLDPVHIFPITHTTIFNICRMIVSLCTVDPMEVVTQSPRIPEVIERMRLCATLGEMQQHIHQFFLLLHGLISHNEKYNSNSEKMQRIIDFVNENYKNPMFDAGMVSDRFDISPSYLSRIFKEQVGVNLLAYVQTLRISAAKELLLNTEMTVERIAENVGYVGGQNLLRLFKKFEGVSPTEYRIAARGLTGKAE